jgi:hypothetical protein
MSKSQWSLNFYLIIVLNLKMVENL